jgi:hypothetical protein
MAVMEEGREMKRRKGKGETGRRLKVEGAGQRGALLF